MEIPKKRILCVDDDEDTCLLLTLLLRDYEVIAVGSLKEAVQLMANQSFDLYLLDNWLGGDSGIQLCQYIKTADPNTPIIFCSGVAYERDREEALQAGAQEYLLKPVEPSILQTAVAKHLEQSEWQNLEAKIAEMFAIHDVVAECLSQADKKLHKVKEMLAKVEAHKVFIKAGGNRANFERLWSETWQEATQDSL